MKKHLLALAATLCLGTLNGQSSPMELADMEYTLMGKSIKYNRIQFLHPSTNQIEQQIDFEWNGHRKLLKAIDSADFNAFFHWTGSISGNTNSIDITYGGKVVNETHLYWDQQHRDTLLEFFEDTNYDGALDKISAMRFHYGPHGIDHLYLYDFSQGQRQEAMHYVTYRNAQGDADSVIAYVKFFNMSFPALAYYYQYSGNKLSQLTLYGKTFFNAPLLKADFSHDATGLISSALISEFDSSSLGWLASSKVVFSLESTFDQDEILAPALVDLYPNPTYHLVETNSEVQGTIEIHSMDGRLMYQNDLITGRQLHHIDDLPGGFYIVHLQSGQQMTSRTLCKL